MVTVRGGETENHSGPAEVNDQNVQFWCKHTKELQNSQVNKALQFIRHECVKYVAYDAEFDSKYTFLCLPLNTEDKVVIDDVELPKKPFVRDYNSSIYKLYKNEDGNFECNCQGWQTKAKKGDLVSGGANCAHVLALYYCFKMKKFGRSQGAEEHHLEVDT